MNRVKRGVLFLACGGSIVALAGPTTAGEVSVARADGGLVATASFGATPGGPQRNVSLVLVVPSGNVISSDGSSFAGPWAAVRAVDAGTGASCQSSGAPVEVSTGRREGHPARLVGVTVVLECGGRSYAVHWGNSQAWLYSSALSRTSGERVLPWSDGNRHGTVSVWPDEQQPSPVTLCTGPVGGPKACAGAGGTGSLMLSSTGIVTTSTS